MHQGFLFRLAPRQMITQQLVFEQYHTPEYQSIIAPLDPQTTQGVYRPTLYNLHSSSSSSDDG